MTVERKRFCWHTERERKCYSRCRGKRAKTKPSTTFAHANWNRFSDRIRNQLWHMEHSLTEWLSYTAV